ncbi:Nucleosomal histone kinase 1 [Eumeta japonica]|uniref:non-specific serine/threonine protein kinase n=1 Tax=Eumeta variegata TaxID=151549 RepID=A0A4C1ZSM7_EUMVA|nr:Nucleosomal histone kinase 1 [Eumeta japonica]
MPRRVVDIVSVVEPPRKKSRVFATASPSPCSFFDDEALPPGIIFTDVQQKKWRIGKPIGRGSFGRIYLASSETDKEVSTQNARYVVKVEPHTNGPLFVEVHCLIRTAQAEKVRAWRLQRKQKHFGMPVYIASGSFTDDISGIKYRFLVLPRYEVDLQKIIARNKILDLRNVLILAVQILDVLEYFHKEGYTHSDIKSSNLMLGFDGSKLSKIATNKVLSFQKDIKEVALLSGKPRRPKTIKTRTANYYDDEDFVVEDYKFGPGSSEENDRLGSLKKKLSKILSEKQNRTSHRHHAFNLRQLTNYVDYEDLSSSICSDQSYQKLLDSTPKKHVSYSSDEGFHEDNFNFKKRSSKDKTDLDIVTNDRNSIFKEAILSQSNGQIYLLDYGLASKFLDSVGNHKDFGMDARKAHDGTLEYSSRDSHIGAHSRRSDLETLGYNLLDWLTGTLPWRTTEMLSEPDLVHALKKNFMSDVKSLLRACFKTDFYPKFLEKYFHYVTCLEFTEKPDYEYCKNIFRSEFVKNFGNEKDMNLQFTEPPISPIKRKNIGYSRRFGRKNTPADFAVKNGIKKAYERENICSLENDIKLELLKQTLNTSSDSVRKPCASRNFFISDADLVTRLKKSLMPQEILGKKVSPKNLRSAKRNIQKKKNRRNHKSSIGKFGNFMGSARQFTWAEILAGNPENIIRKERNNNPENANSDEFDDTCKYRIRKISDSSDCTNFEANLQSPLMQKDYLQGTNPTYAMKEVLSNFRRKASGKPAKDQDESENDVQGYTPAMMRLLKLKEKREARERLQEMKESEEIKNTHVKRTRASRCKANQNKKDDEKMLALKKTFIKSKKVCEQTNTIKTNNVTIVRQSRRKNNKVIHNKGKSLHNKKPVKSSQVSINGTQCYLPTMKVLRSQTKKMSKQVDLPKPVVVIESVDLETQTKSTSGTRSQGTKSTKRNSKSKPRNGESSSSVKNLAEKKTSPEKSHATQEESRCTVFKAYICDEKFQEENV